MKSLILISLFFSLRAIGGNLQECASKLHLVALPDGKSVVEMTQAPAKLVGLGESAPPTKYLTAKIWTTSGMAEVGLNSTQCQKTSKNKNVWDHIAESVKSTAFAFPNGSKDESEEMKRELIESCSGISGELDQKLSEPAPATGKKYKQIAPDGQAR